MKAGQGAVDVDVELPRDFAPRVVAWQRRHGRHGLPWQGTRDAYRIWLSEIMLQQTQVSTVLRYYDAFLRRFPTVADLAAVPTDDVLAAWSGLGYYSRARNLHRCAQVVVAEHAGVFPTSAAVLQTLPGIGRSTAAAVAAFSRAERVAILDGNVKRVLSRVLGFEDDVARPQGQRRLWELAEALLPLSGIEPYTQGLMDLGATLCTSRRPRCTDCPVASDCVAQRTGRQQEFPVKTRRIKRGVRESVVLMWPLRSGAGGHILLWRRPASGVWPGLWSLPEWDDEAACRQDLHALESHGELLARPAFVHVLTHLDWTLRPLVLDLPSPAEPQRVRDELERLQGERGQGGGSLEWVPMPQALERGLPAPIRRLLEDEFGLRRAPMEAPKP